MVTLLMYLGGSAVLLAMGLALRDQAREEHARQVETDAQEAMSRRRV